MLALKDYIGKVLKNHQKNYLQWGYNWGPLPFHRVPTRTGKPGKMGRHFPIREKSGNFEQSGKVRENNTKYWKTQGI